MYCQKCGTQNSDTAKFCSKCGANLQQASAEPAARTQGTIPPQNVQTSQPVQEKNNSALIGLILGIISIIVVWFIGWIALVTSIVGLILGSKKRTGPGAGTAGRVLNTISLVLAAITMVVSIVFGSMLVASLF